MRPTPLTRALIHALGVIVRGPIEAKRIGCRPPDPVRRLDALVPPSDARVSVGVPVRNGADYLAKALQTLVRQTHRNLEIVISDNASTDATPTICAEFVASDPRVRYVRQTKPLNANANFCAAFQECSGEWFLWAGHDDLRDLNYVEVLLEGFRHHPRTPLVFTDIEYFSDHRSPETSITGNAKFRPTDGLPFPENHRALVENSAFQFYGLYRSEVLRMYRWPELRAGHDWLILHWLLAFGKPQYVPGSRFQYFMPPVVRAPRAYQAYHSLESTWFDNVRNLPDVAWAFDTAHELSYARNALGEPTAWEDLVPMFALMQYGGTRDWARVFAHANSPEAARQLWRWLRARRARKTGDGASDNSAA